MKQTAKEIGIEGRILNLSSIAHVYTYEEGIQFDNINDEDGYSDKKAYGQSKLANILHTNDLSHRLQRGNLAVARFIDKIREAQIAKPCLRQPSSSKPSNDFLSLSAFDNVRVTTTATLTSHKSLDSGNSKETERYKKKRLEKKITGSLLKKFETLRKLSF
ncbi:hypothetical protein JHK85_024782 [Glycine max]|nr:hypothetical protein JHK85_024782 [Glycine max]